MDRAADLTGSVQLAEINRLQTEPPTLIVDCQDTLRVWPKQTSTPLRSSPRGNGDTLGLGGPRRNHAQAATAGHWRESAQRVTRAWNDWLAADPPERGWRYRAYEEAFAGEEKPSRRTVEA